MRTSTILMALASCLLSVAFARPTPAESEQGPTIDYDGVPAGNLYHASAMQRMTQEEADANVALIRAMEKVQDSMNDAFTLAIDIGHKKSNTSGWFESPEYKSYTMAWEAMGRVNDALEAAGYVMDATEADLRAPTYDGNTERLTPESFEWDDVIEQGGA